MKDSSYRTFGGSSAGLVMLLLTVGCATQSDLEQVRRGLSADLDTAKSQAQTALRAVNEKLDVVQADSRARFEAEGKVMVALQNRADEIDAKIQALNSRLAAAHNALTAEMTDVRKVMQEASARREADLARFHRVEERLSTLSVEARRIQSALLNLTSTLVRHNQGEGEALKQHLREMEILTKDPEAGSGPPSQNFGESYRQP